MSNLPILYATLWILIWFPAGYWLGFLCDPQQWPRKLVSAELGVWFGLRVVDRLIAYKMFYEDRA